MSLLFCLAQVPHFSNRHSPKSRCFHIVAVRKDCYTKGCLRLKERELHYFAVGNTARGYYSLYDSNLAGLQKLFILMGNSRNAKSALLHQLWQTLKEEDLHFQIIHSASNPDEIEGLIIEELAMGIVDGRIPEVNQAKRHKIVERYIHVDELCDCMLSIEQKEELSQLTKQADIETVKAYEAFSQALRIHDEWEAIFIDNMDFEQANELAEELMATLFNHQSQLRKGKVYHRFLGAATPIGAIDFVPNLTNEIANRYFIKGRPGSGKSTMLKKIMQQAEARGFDVEVYHCGFDPHSLDMIIVRELNFAIFDSTAPHEYDPNREGDVIVDVYERCIRSGTDDDYSLDIANVSKRYRAKMNEATFHLAQAKIGQDRMEEVYLSAMNTKKLNDINKQLLQLIQPLIVKQ